MRNIDCLFLAAGYGNRAKPLTLWLPKPLLPLIKGVSSLQFLVDDMRKKSKGKFYVNTHYLSEKFNSFKSENEDITFLNEEILSGNKIVSRIESKNKILMVNSDTFLKIPLDLMIEKMDRCNYDVLLLTRRIEREGVYRELILNQKNEVINIGETRQKGLLMFAGAVLLKEDINVNFKEERFFDSIFLNSYSCGVLDYNDIWLDIGSPYDYLNTVLYLAKQKNLSSHINSYINDDVEISDNASIENSLVLNDVQMLDNCILKDSIVMPGIKLKNIKLSDVIVSCYGIFPLIN